MRVKLIERSRLGIKGVISIKCRSIGGEFKKGRMGNATWQEGQVSVNKVQQHSVMMLEITNLFGLMKVRKMYLSVEIMGWLHETLSSA